MSDEEVQPKKKRVAKPKVVKADPFERFAPYLNKLFRVKFARHAIEDPVELISVGKKGVTGFNLAPEKRLVDGKKKSPELFALTFAEFELVFVAEDTIVQTTLDGLVITCGPTVVECLLA